MPLSKHWSQSKANVLMTEDGSSGARTRNALWHLKDGLINSTTGPWEVLASSGKNNGGTLTASLSDNWVVPNDIQYGYPDSSAARGWIVLESPNTDYGRFYLTLDYWATSSGYDYRCQIYFSNTQPLLMGFSTTARPAAGGPEWSHLEETFFNSFGSVYRFDCHLMTAHDGSFVFFGNYAENPTITMALIFNVIEDAKAEDSSAAVSLHWGDLSAGMTQSSLPSFQGLHPVDDTVVDIDGVALLAGLTTGPHIIDVLPDDTANKRLSKLPVWLFSTTASKRSLRGRLQDIYWAPSKYQEGIAAYEENTFTFTKVGPFWVPIETIPML
jgi:hypothetical protein